MSHAVDVAVMDSSSLNPLASLFGARNTMKPAEAISKGVMEKIVKALKTLSDENKELRTEISNMRESQTAMHRTELMPTPSRSLGTQNFVDPKRKMGWMPVD